MPYPVNEVADFVIDYANDQGNPVNNFKFQKVLYYLEARFLIEISEPLFIEQIQKWRYGPVIPNVYFRFNHLGANDITQGPMQFDFISLLEPKEESPNTEPAVGARIFAEDKRLIRDTVDRLLSYNLFTLVNETHKHPAWQKDEKRILSGVRDLPYSFSEIPSDFLENPHFGLWETAYLRRRTIKRPFAIRKRA